MQNSAKVERGYCKDSGIWITKNEYTGGLILKPYKGGIFQKPKYINMK